MASLKNYLKLLNHPSKILPLINYTLLTLFGAVLLKLNIPLIPLILVIIGIDSAWIFSVGINDFYDIEIDKVINPDRPLISGDLSGSEVKKFTIFFALVALIISLICSLLYIFWIIIFVGIYLLLGVFYSSPPIRIKMRTPLSTIVIGITCSISILAGGFITSINKELFFSPNYKELIFVSIAIGVIAFMVSLAKDYKDIPGDKAAEIPTLPVIYGPEKTAKILLTAGIFSYSIFFFFPIFNTVYFLSYPAIIFAVTSWIIIHIYYIRVPDKERANILYKLGFLGFLVIIISLIILKIFF